MNEKKICFIIYGYDKQYQKECVKYIGQLRRPEKYEIDILSMCEEKGEFQSAACWYHEKMKQSDAKYKIYLRQEVFLINRNCLFDLLEIFEADSAVGMIGVIGSRKLHSNGDLINSWDSGRMRIWDLNDEVETSFDANKITIEVEAVNGFFMATQYDLQWREDLFDGECFYDAAQALEFRRKGYKIVLPYQKEIWCLYDQGYNNWEKYDEYRERFCHEYSDYGFRFEEIPLLEGVEELYAQIREKMQKVKIAIQENRFQELDILAYELENIGVKTKESGLLVQMLQIRKKEADSRINCFWQNNCTYEELLERYTFYMFMLREIEYDFAVTEYADFLDNIFNQTISLDCIYFLVEHCVYEKGLTADYITRNIIQRGVKQITEQVDVLLKCRRYDEVVNLIQQNDLSVKGNTELSIIRYLCSVYQQEKSAGNKTIFEKATGIDLLLDRYTRLKFYLRRIDFDIGRDNLDVFREFFNENQISLQEIVLVVQQAVVHKDKVLQIIEESCKNKGV